MTLLDFFFQRFDFYAMTNGMCLQNQRLVDRVYVSNEYFYIDFCI